ncbi:MAG: EamA family transporter RarD [Vibrio sp.]
MTTQPTLLESEELAARAKQGVIFAVAAYTIWGIAPIYFKSIIQVAPLEILSHRIIWSFLFLAVLLYFTKGWQRIGDTIKDKKKCLFLLGSSVTIACNWLVFIWAVNNNHMLDASLGYYINPLFSVLLGMLFMQERLRKLQWFAVALAAVGVIVQLIVFGSLPIVALILATSFGIYGLLRKKVNLDAMTGLFIETLVLLPVALAYMLLIADSPTSVLSQNSLQLNTLLISAGIITTVPLLCFAGAATRLRLSTLGFIQYIGPSLMFILAVFAYGEAFSQDKIITFACIWLALIVFTFDGLKHRPKRAPAAIIK